MASPIPNQHDFLIFTKYFFRYTVLIRHILISLLILITVLGVILSYLEDLDVGEGIYFAYEDLTTRPAETLEFFAGS